jgi:virulence-associated protein VapD
MHGNPIFEKVRSVKEDLREQELREKHPDLKKAYEDYQTLLTKYGFWNDITK